LTTAEISNITC